MGDEVQDGRAERLAEWVRRMDLADQVLLTGATLVLEDVRTRRGAFPAPFDEAVLREGTPSEAYREALAIRDAYAGAPVHLVPDGVDENERIVGLASAVLERIVTYHPFVAGGID